MHLQFFPSRQISFYMARLFLLRSLAVLVMLVLILQSLDLLGESGKILAVPGNTESDVFIYLGMRLPQIVAKFLPFSVLLGTLFTFMTLSQNSEVVAMKAAGLSAHQILAPMFVASFMVAVMSFGFNDAVVAPATAKLKVWQDVDYAKVPPDSGIKENVWVREGQDLISAGKVIGTGPGTKLQDVRLYMRQQGGLTQVIEGANASYVDDAWRLQNVKAFDVAAGTQKTYSSLDIAKGITPDRFNILKADGDSLAFVPLMGAISEMHAAGRSTTSLQASLQHKISGPLSTVLMPLLAAVAAFGLARSGALLIRAAIGMVLGFTYFVADNFALAMGNLGAYPPFVAAWGPFFLFLLIGETVLIRTEE